MSQLSIVCLGPGVFHCQGLRRADTQTPTRHSVFSTSTPTRKRFPHSTVYKCLKAFFRHASVFKTHRHAVYHCLKEVQKPFRRASVCKTKGPNAHPKSRNTKKTPRSHELFQKVRANFSLLSCDTSQEPNGTCSDKLVQMNFFYFGCIFSGGFFTLPALQKNFVNIFFVFAWEFCIEKWRGFLVHFFWSPSPTKRRTKSP